MEQLEDPAVAVDLDERRDGGVPETGVSVLRVPSQLGLGDGPAGEGVHDSGGDLVKGPPGEARYDVRLQARPALRRHEGRHRARPASTTSSKPSTGARPLVEMYLKADDLPVASTLTAQAVGRCTLGRGTAADKRAGVARLALEPSHLGRSLPPPSDGERQIDDDQSPSQSIPGERVFEVPVRDPEHGDAPWASLLRSRAVPRRR